MESSREGGKKNTQDYSTHIWTHNREVECKQRREYTVVLVSVRVSVKMDE